MSLDNYNRVKVIGSGSYGEVWLSKHKADRKQVEINTTSILLLQLHCLYYRFINYLFICICNPSMCGAILVVIE